MSTQQLLLDIIQDHGLSQMVLEPTCSDNILDLFFTSVPTLIEKIQIIPGLSDHDVVVVQTKMRISATKQTNRRIPLYNKANWEAMRNEIEPLEGEINNLVLQTVHIDDVWRKLSDSILHVVNKYIPYKITRKRRSLPWISVQLRKQIKRRDKLYRQAKRSGSADIYSRFLDLKHSIQREMRKSYWQYINSLILPESVGNVNGSQQQKKFWSYIRSLKKDNNETSSLYTPDGFVTENNKKAEVLNAQFKSVFTVEPNESLPDKGPSPHPTMPDFNITISGIKKLLHNLNVHKATGPDEISARVLKELGDILAPTLKIIFDYSLYTGTVCSNIGKWQMSLLSLRKVTDLNPITIGLSP